jgi:hypothetical protein
MFRQIGADWFGRVMIGNPVCWRYSASSQSVLRPPVSTFSSRPILIKLAVSRFALS